MPILAEYVWCDGNGIFRSKSRVLYENPQRELKGEGGGPGLHVHMLAASPQPHLAQGCARGKIKSSDIGVIFSVAGFTRYPEWSYDGSSTGEASGKDSEVLLKPVAVYVDPFKQNCVATLVLCDTYNAVTDEPLPTSHRPWANKLFNSKVKGSGRGRAGRSRSRLHEAPWFGIEQEFFIMTQNSDDPTKNSNIPMGWKTNANTQGQYYCSVGSNNAFGRHIVEEAYLLAIHAGINVTGMNAEVAPGQWEIQVLGRGIDAGDYVQILRYILQRVGEKHGVQINMSPKPVTGDWNGSGAHCNFSTKNMRNGTDDKEGIEYILDAIGKLESKHKEHMKVYGEGNRLRCSGLHETASYDTFSFGVADRGASIRIPRSTHSERKGYLEDRRPAANVNPYLLIGNIFNTTCC
jgi:glutamine synthetase